MTGAQQTNRREHVRFKVPPRYSTVTAWGVDDPTAPPLQGHAYDLSESGVRIELDEPLAPGQSVSLHLGLPFIAARVHARADVVWINSADDDPGPRRMALRFTGFLSDSDHDCLVSYLVSGQLRRAA